MSKNLTLIVLLITLIFSSVSFGQRKHKRDWDKWKDFDDIAWIDIDPGSMPMIEFNYGFSQIDQKKFAGEFSKTGLLELKLGYSNTFSDYPEYLIEREDNFIFGGIHDSKYASEDFSSGEFNAEMWQLGLGKREGYGFDMGEIQIIPYTQNSIVWNRLKMSDIPPAPVSDDTLITNAYQNDLKIIDRFNESFRFGMDYETGLKVNVASFVDISGGYQFGEVFPRYLIWKHMGSFAVETAGLALLDTFIREIMDSSPAAGPLMNVLLKGAYYYAFHQLKKENMNWPFKTESPLTYETFKFGVTFTF